jgi:hypothetical protein
MPPQEEAIFNRGMVGELNHLINENMKVWSRHGMTPARPRPGDRFFSLAFNSSQFGYVNIRTGDFYMMGWN